MPNLSDFKPEDITLAESAPAPNVDDQNAPLTLDSIPAEVPITYVPGGIAQAKYGSLGENVAGFTEKAAETASFGASKLAERGLYELTKAKELSPEAIKGREEELPGLATFGANVLGALSPIGVGGRILKTGAVLTSEILGREAASKLTGKMLAGAIEGALFQGGSEVGKLAQSESPDELRDLGAAAPGNFLLASALGGGIGAALHPLSKFYEAKFGNKLQENLQAAHDNINGPPPPPGAPSGEMINSEQPPETELLQGLNGKKPNLEQLNQDKDLFGIEKLTPGMESSEKTVQNAEGNLEQQPTFRGVGAAKEKVAINEKINKGIEENFRDRTELSQHEVGKKIGEGFKKEIENESKALGKEYDAYEPILEKIQVPEHEMMDTMTNVINDPVINDNLEMRKVADKTLKDVSEIENVPQLRNKRTFIRGLASKADAASDTNSSYVYEKIYKELTNLRTRLIKSSDNEGLIDLDSRYAAHKAKVEQAGIETGLSKKLSGARDLVNILKRTNASTIGERFMNLSDVDTMRFLKENYPEQFELARRAKLNEFYKDGINNSKGGGNNFEYSRIHNKLLELGPEARDLLFDGNQSRINKIDAAARLYASMPANPNPSGTSYAAAWLHLLSGQGIKANLMDALKYGIDLAGKPMADAVKSAGGDEAAQLAGAKAIAASSGSGIPPSSEGFNATAKYYRAAIKGENTVGKAIGSVFKSGPMVLPTTIIEKQKNSREKLDNKLKGLQSNNSDLMNAGEGIGHYLPMHGMAIAKSASTISEYLNSLRPDDTKKSPLDSEVKPNPVAKANYERALDIAREPLLAIEGIKEGKIIPQEIAHLKTLYPGLYTRLSKKLMNGMIEHVSKGETIPYKTRMGLSIFLDQPLDSTMTQQSIMANQLSKNVVTPSEQPKPTQNGMNKLSKLSATYATPGQARMLEKTRARA